MNSFVLYTLNRIFDSKTVENTHARQKKEGFLLFCARLIVSLQSEMSTETTVIEKNQIKKPL